MASQQQQVCLYETLGVDRSASVEEIRLAYRKLALKWHPDKIQQTGASLQECQDATVRFQEIGRAYEVLTDPTERAWYDSHRSEILSASPSPSGGAPADFDFNVWPYFSPGVFSGYGETGRGFYAVYTDVFEKLQQQEKAFSRAYGGLAADAPPMGGPGTPYAQVASFYSYWAGFSTVKDFSWCDEYKITFARNRKERRLMEDENMKLRRKARREFNEAVRQLSLFVRKRDKRVMERQVELQRLQKDKEIMLKLRRKQAEEEKLRKARQYVEAEWTKVSYDLGDEDGSGDENQGSYDWDGFKRVTKGGKGNNKGSQEELFCIVCNKKFRSEKQWKNHEKSKKHRERAAALKDSFVEEEEEEINEEDSLDSLEKEEAEGLTIEVETIGICNGTALSNGRDADVHTNNFSDSLQDDNWGLGNNPGSEEFGSDEEDFKEISTDDEDSLLVAMLNFQKKRQQGKEGQRSPMGDGVRVTEELECQDDEANVLSKMLNAQRVRKPAKGEWQEGGGVGEREGERGGGADIAESPSVASRNEKDEESNTGSISKWHYSRRVKLEKKHTAIINRHAQLAEFSSLEQVIDKISLIDNGLIPTDDGPGDEAEEAVIDNGLIPTDDGPRDEVEEAVCWKDDGETAKTKTQDLRNKQSRPSGGSKGIESITARSNKGKKQMKGQKNQGSSKNSPNTCGTCGEEFESRNQLFKHINGTSHSVQRAVR